jgi:hypothetical protein
MMLIGSELKARINQLEELILLNEKTFGCLKELEGNCEDQERAELEKNCKQIVWQINEVQSVINWTAFAIVLVNVSAVVLTIQLYRRRKTLLKDCSEKIGTILSNLHVCMRKCEESNKTYRDGVDFSVTMREVFVELDSIKKELKQFKEKSTSNGYISLLSGAATVLSSFFLPASPIAAAGLIFMGGANATVGIYCMPSAGSIDKLQPGLDKISKIWFDFANKQCSTWYLC